MMITKSTKYHKVPSDDLRCSAIVYVGLYPGSQCLHYGKNLENGKLYCKQHTPSILKARRAEQEAQWQGDWAALNTHRATLAETERRAACYDDLLAACKLILDASKVILLPGDPEKILAKVLAAVMKAEGG